MPVAARYADDDSARTAHPVAGRSEPSAPPVVRRVDTTSGSKWKLNWAVFLGFTDWNTGALFTWTAKSGKKDLATGFKGPADFCVVQNAEGWLVVVPDLPQSHLRFIQLTK